MLSLTACLSCGTIPAYVRGRRTIKNSRHGWMDGWMRMPTGRERETGRRRSPRHAPPTCCSLGSGWLRLDWTAAARAGVPCLTGHHQPSRACLYLTADHHPSRSPAVRAWIITARGTARWDKHATRSSVHASMR